MPKTSDWHILSSQSRYPKSSCIQQVQIPSHFLSTSKKLSPPYVNNLKDIYLITQTKKL